MNLPMNAFAAQSYTVTFDADGSLPNPDSQQVEEGSYASQPIAVEKEGYRLKGWINVSGRTWDFANDKVTGNVTLKADWKQLKKITFDTDGGSPIAAVYADVGEKITRPADPVKEGFKLTGWVNSNLFWYFKEDTVAGDMTLKAQWRSICKVSFDSDGGSPVPASGRTYMKR